jgi:YVTN family beta-propeller protein
MTQPSMRSRLVASLALGATTLAGCGGGERVPASGDSAGASASAATGAAPAARVGSGAPLVYVSNEDGNDIAVIDSRTDSVISTIFVGKRPRGIDLSPDGRTLYVAVSGSPKAPPGVDESTLPPPDRAADGIAVIDAATRKLTATLKSGQDPEAFAVSRDGKKVYVSNEDAGTTSVVDVASGRVVKAIRWAASPRA